MYYSDTPIASPQNDQLGRNNFAKLLARTLLNLKTQDTFTVGLFGKWGSGKTSIVNMMLHEMEERQKNSSKDEKLTIVHFEPWNFSNTNQLLTQFFIRLSNEFRSSDDRRLVKIGDALEKYSDAFDLLNAVPYVGGLIGFLGKKGTVAVGNKLKNGSDEKDISKQKEAVVKLLTEQASRILVVIDDIDRLSNKQIRQVFQLVTSVAKFPNTIYLLVFDKDIVVKALEKVQEGDGEDYLEKIIQMPIQIPDINPARLRQVLLNRLNIILSEHKGLGFHQYNWERLCGPCILPFVDSLRTVNRLCNVLQFKIADIYEEIDFTDMVAISVLEIQFPEVYEWIKANKSVLTGENDLSIIGNRNQTQKGWLELYAAQIRGLLQQGNGLADDLEVEKIMEFLSNLFPHFGRKIGKIYEVYDRNSFRRNNQIAHSDKFDRYFAFDLSEIAIHRSTVEEVAFVYDCETLAEILMEQEQNGNSYEFLEEIRAIASELPSDRIKTIIRTLLMVSVYLKKPSPSILGWPAKVLAEQMVMELLEMIDDSERSSFLLSIIHSGDLMVLESVAYVINKIELSYGRLAANGEEQGNRKIVTLEELRQIETTFTEEVKEVLTKNNLFDMERWSLVYYLLDNFDADYAKTYLQSALSQDANIVKYVAGSIKECTGIGVSYEVEDSYKKDLTEERVLQAIEAVKESKDFFSMSEEIQHKCAAFCLKATSEEYRNRTGISQRAADKLLDSWKR